MADIKLREYISGESLTAFNAPHLYRIAKKMGQDADDYVRIWKTGKTKILKQLIEKLQEISFEGFVVAPTNTPYFNSDLEKALVSSFPNAVNFTKCFAKLNNFPLLTTNSELSEQELKKRFTLNKNCFNTFFVEDIKQILLVDDVFSIGNTFRGMEFLIKDIHQDIQIIKAVILKTT